MSNHDETPEGYAEALEREVAARTIELELSEARLRAALDESQSQREQLELVLDASNAAIGEWNVADDTMQLSDSWYRMLGYEPGEIDLSISRWQDHVHPDDWADLLSRAEASDRAHDPIVELTLRVRHKDGSWRWNRHRGVVTDWDTDGHPERILGIELDVTDQHSLEQQLIHSAKMEALGAFAGGIAHDFNNVLAIIQGNAEALERMARDQSALGQQPANQQLERVTSIQQAVDRAASLIRNLMLLNRPTSGGPGRVDLTEFLLRSNESLPYLLGEDVRLEITVPPHPVLVGIEEGRFEAVILNLAANARDAMPIGGKFTITLTTSGDRQNSALLYVTDTGIGMEPETLGSIFEPFFTTKAPGTGTGLGLATAYATIASAHGMITADSQPGKGTTITVVVPMMTDAERPAPEGVRATTSTTTSSSAAVVLVVEDEAELLELTSDVLRDHGFRVHEALAAEEALEILRNNDDIDLVLTDAVMPGMNGPELASIIRRHWPLTEVMLVSGYAAESPLNDGFSDDRVLTKPITSEQLLNAVEGVLRSR